MRSRNQRPTMAARVAPAVAWSPTSAPVPLVHKVQKVDKVRKVDKIQKADKVRKVLTAPMAPIVPRRTATGIAAIACRRTIGARNMSSTTGARVIFNRRHPGISGCRSTAISCSQLSRRA
jgi:hypothetical protein